MHLLFQYKQIALFKKQIIFLIIIRRRSIYYSVKNTITEEKLEQIQPYLDHNFLSHEMNSGLLDVYQNKPDKFIDYQECFRQYRC